MSKLLGSIIFCLFATSSVLGQISITDQDLLGLVGSSFNIEEDTSEMLVIDPGAPGANQVWDLSQPLNSSFSITREFVNPSETPFALNFATANLAERITVPGFAEGAIYNYYEIGSNRVVELGNAALFESMGMSFENVNEDLHLVAPLPITTASSWSETIKDTTVQAGAFTNILFDSTVVTVDGWGKIRLPGGEYDCLRLFEQCWTKSQTVINDVIIDSSSESALSYIWVNKNNFILASVTSQDGETDPNFQNVSSFSRLAGGTTSNENFLDLSQHLQIVGPNPFAANLELVVQLDQATDVHLNIFDQQGMKVKTLLHGAKIDGTQNFSWDGRSEASGTISSGTYVVLLQTNRGHASKMVQLVR